MASTARDDGLGAGDGGKPKKAQRISQACDFCNRRSIRCRPSTENPQQQCQNCHDFGIPCTYDRPPRRRRPNVQHQPPNALPSQLLQPEAVSWDRIRALHVLLGRVTEAYPLQQRAKHSPQDEHTDRSNAGGLPPPSPTSLGNWTSVHQNSSHDPDEIAWYSFATIGASTIKQFLVVYMRSVFPIYPLFHEPTLWDRFKRQQHLTDRGFFASIMSACALGAARVRDGAVFLDAGSVGPSSSHSNETTSSSGTFQSDIAPDAAYEMFFAAARNAVLKDFNKNVDHGMLRACGLLALNCIQNGKIREMHQHMGHYHTLSAMCNFHDETFWSDDLEEVEMEERRRIFWCMYQLSVFIACVFNGPPRIQDVFVNVGYPNEAPDHLLDVSNFEPSISIAALPKTSWVHGWNATTELYRLLEHTLTRIRTNRARREGRATIGDALMPNGVPAMSINQQIMTFYHSLPAEFRDLSHPFTEDDTRNIIGFQVAHIQATMQMCRMTLIDFDPHMDGLEKCDIVAQVLTAFQAIDSQYLRTISAPLVWHLRCIGQLLASVLQGPLTRELSQETRRLLLLLADLLDNLESGMHVASGAGTVIRAQMATVDQYLHEQGIQDKFADMQGLPHLQQSAAPLTQREVPSGPTYSAFSTQSTYQPGDEYFSDSASFVARSALPQAFYLPQNVPNANGWGFFLDQQGSIDSTYGQAQLNAGLSFDVPQHLTADPTHLTYPRYQGDEQ